MRRVCVSFLIRSFLLLTLVFVSSYAFAQKNVPGDSVKVQGDSLKNIAKKNVKVGEDSLRAMKLADLEEQSDLKTSITYQAKSYMLLDMENKTLYLHDGGELKYESMSMKADSVSIDWSNNTMYADGLVDSMGQKSGRPGFTENDQTYKADRMAYNFKTQKGLVTMARTKQGSEYIIGEKVKKEDDNTYYIKNGKFTSCDLEHPHYYIKSSKLKVIPRDKIITGPLMLVIEDFPLPLLLPFGFFPNQTGQRSGILMPTYGESAERGFFLRNGGYYLALGDHMDLAIRGDIFSKGGYRLEVSTAYDKRYAYKGKFAFEYGLQKFGQKDDPIEFQKRTSNFKVVWQHDQKINPQANLTSNVNLVSSGFLQANSYNEQDYLTNTLKSTVNFSQSFANSPWRLNVVLDHSQNTQTKQVTLGLPNITMNRTRMFPFKGQNATGNKWYHNIGVGYSSNIKNQISVPDSILSQVLLNPAGNVTSILIENQDTTLVTKKSLDYFNNGMIHSVPISTQLTLANYINVQPSINYHEYWYIRSKDYSFNPDSNQVQTNDIYGFAAARDFDMNLNTSTRIYGLFQGKGKKQMTFRHTLQPSLGYRFKPDFSTAFWGFYQELPKDTVSTETQFYNRFSGGIVGGPSAGEQQEVNFGLNNVLEMKYRSKAAAQDTTSKDPYTRITLLDQLAFNMRYNFAADSLNLSPMGFVARTNILNNKFTFQLSGAIDPYAVNAEGRTINTFRYEKNGSLARLSSMNFTFNTVLGSGKGKNKAVGPTAKNAAPEELSDLRLYRDLYVDFNIPWKLNLSTNIRYTNTGISRDTSITLNFSGDFNLSPKWKVGYTSGYDISQNDFSYTSMTLYRDLHCWEMSMTWIPFGNRKSYNFTLNVKSATLKDLKLTKRRDWQDRF